MFLISQTFKLVGITIYH